MSDNLRTGAISLAGVTGVPVNSPHESNKELVYGSRPAPVEAPQRDIPYNPLFGFAVNFSGRPASRGVPRSAPVQMVHKMPEADDTTPNQYYMNNMVPAAVPITAAVEPQMMPQSGRVSQRAVEEAIQVMKAPAPYAESAKVGAELFSSIVPATPPVAVTSIPAIPPITTTPESIPLQEAGNLEDEAGIEG